MSMPAEHLQSTADLAELLQGYADAPSMPVYGIASDSRLVAPGSLFLACAGIRSHGLDYVDVAVAAGAVAIAYDSTTAAAPPPKTPVPAIAVPDLAAKLGEIASRFHGDPSAALGVVGVTGTNGKTTVAWLLAQCLQRLDKPCGYVGTLGHGVDEVEGDENLTTPDTVALHGYLAEFRNAGATNAVLEVSSHALAQDRVAGIAFDTVMFTNLSRDHLDYHGDMHSYFEAKARLFTEYPARQRIINVDSEFGALLADRCRDDVVVVSTQLDRVANGRRHVFVRSVVADTAGSRVRVSSSWGDGEFALPLPGDFNVANAVLVLAFLLQRDIPFARACATLEQVQAPPGRMQRVPAPAGRPAVYVDYAHTPDALAVALAALRRHCRGRLYCVFGCGGDRDVGKRPLMGRAAERNADAIVVTSDNPRGEPPVAILDAIVAGLQAPERATVIEDRAAAIGWAIGQCGADDTVLIAGKGHEDYQVIGDERRAFADFGVALASLGAPVTTGGASSTLSAVAAAVQGRLHGEDATFAGVSTDTRTLRPGELFVALRGPNFDGNAFVATARERGAAGALVTGAVADPLPTIEVADTRDALGRLASWWRQQQPATVVGVTGSNGKTTLKELIASCLAQSAPTLATAGNLNNDIGMPLMLLRLESTHRFAVIEMGANHVGEIAYLTSLARPEVAVITNAGSAHLEGFGSIEGVARGKGEILEGEPRPRAAVLNRDDDFFDYWSERVADVELLSFGLHSNADVYADDIVAGADGTRFRLHLSGVTLDVTLPLAGRHNVRNACAAAAVATALGIPPAQIAAGLEAIEPVSGRLRPLPGRGGAALYDDSYNANPDSVVAAGEFLGALPGRSWLVLGDMFELGDDAVAMHRDVGTRLRETGVERLFALGDLSRHAVEAFGPGGAWFDSIEQLAATLGKDLASDVNILVKGSRGMRMERVVAALQAPGPDGEGD